MYTAPAYMINGIVLYPSIFLSYSFAPFIGCLADVGFGRYEVIKFGSIASFLASLLYYFAMFAGESASTLSTVLYSIALVIVSFLFISYAAAMLPFLTDTKLVQLQMSLVQLYAGICGCHILAFVCSDFIAHFGTLGNFEKCFCFCCSSCCDHHQVTACVSSGWTRLIRSLTPSSSSYRYSTTLGSTVTSERLQCLHLYWCRNSPH